MRKIFILLAISLTGLGSIFGQSDSIPYEIRLIPTNKVENLFDTLVEIRLMVYETDFKTTENINLTFNKMDGTKSEYTRQKSEIRLIKSIDLNDKGAETYKTRERLQYTVYGKDKKNKVVEISLGVYNLSQISEIKPQLNKSGKK